MRNLRKSPALWAGTVPMTRATASVMKMSATRRTSAAISIACAFLFFSGCNVGPKYQKAQVDTPPVYKEAGDWKVAQPQDAAARGKWWETFNDPQLNALEDQVNISNQNIAAAAANFLSARAMVKQARAQLFPSVATQPSITYSRQPFVTGTGTTGTTGSTGTGSSGSSSGILESGTFAEYVLPFDASWQLDLWGRVRNGVKASVYAAQASAADLQSVRLTAQAEVAVDYFSIRTQDAQQSLLNDTVKAYQDSYDIEKERFDAGLSSNEDVKQAETLLQTVEAQADDIGILRAQYEHAIALLVGKPPAEFSLPPLVLATNPPAIPAAMPSELLERRPDVAAAERGMAQANAEIGVAKAAYYPTVTLSAAGGFESVSAASWFTWPSRFWSVGPGVAETLFDAGARRGVLQQAQAQYDQSVAVYRQTVLTGFVQVEDNLAALRILVGEIQKQDAAVQSSRDNLALATDRYKVGVDPYLNVITAQQTLLGNERTALDLRMEQMTDSVQLIEALGGGWDNSQLPSEQDVRAGRSASSPTVAPAPTAAAPSNP
jgi:NodT family efflux transporter outer membrane factor (OMF) lipoprotein